MTREPKTTNPEFERLLLRGREMGRGEVLDILTQEQPPRAPPAVAELWRMLFAKLQTTRVHAGIFLSVMLLGAAGLVAWRSTLLRAVILLLVLGLPVLAFWCYLLVWEKKNLRRLLHLGHLHVGHATYAFVTNPAKIPTNTSKAFDVLVVDFQAGDGKRYQLHAKGPAGSSAAIESGDPVLILVAPDATRRGMAFTRDWEVITGRVYGPIGETAPPGDSGAGM